MRPLRTTRLPQSIIILSAQAELSGDRTGWSEHWRCGWVFHRRTGGKRRPCEISAPVQTPDRLWRNVTTWCGYAGATHMWVCDLSWIARVSSMFLHLPGLGWELQAFSLAPGGGWMAWRKGRATLRVSDVLTIWPDGFDHIATLFGTARKQVHPMERRWLPWQAAARQDCQILRTAVDAYMTWVSEEDLGPLAVTGNAQCWAAFRRRFMCEGILIHDDVDAREAERRAMWTGRCEAYWHGPLDHAVVHEWDLASAYTHICAEHSVPTLLHGAADPAVHVQSYLDDDRFLLLAEVDIDTDTPVVPTGHNGGIVWPVGHFRTVLWEPEIREALNNGADVRLVRGWRYRHSPALRGWALWILSGLDSQDTTAPSWRRAIQKRWGNVLVGRFGMRYPEWRKTAWNPESDVRYTPVLDMDTGDEYAMMQVGHDVWQQAGERDAHNAAPQVTGYVMSLARAQLWRLMSRLPERKVFYVDTDSMFVRMRDAHLMQALTHTEDGRNLRLKHAWAGMEIYGPRQTVTGDLVRISGVDRRAERVSQHDYEGELTEGLLEAIGQRRLDVVSVAPRQWHVAGTDTRRQGPPVGWTEPFRLDQP